MTDDYVPKALLEQPEMTAYHVRLTERYLLVAEMRPDGLNGPRPVTLREIREYLNFYPVDDVPLFVDHILAIDREVMRDVGKPSRRHN